MKEQELNRLLDVLVEQPKESEWLEFKHNFHSNEEIGERISALSNSACLLDKSFGYLVFGVEDGTHEVLGTTFYGKQTRAGREDLEMWLTNRLSPRIDFEIYDFAATNGRHVCLFRIPAATSRTATKYCHFNGSFRSSAANITPRTGISAL